MPSVVLPNHGDRVGAMAHPHRAHAHMLTKRLAERARHRARGVRDRDGRDQVCQQRDRATHTSIVSLIFQ